MKIKKILSVGAIFLVAVLMTFSACKKDEDSGNPDCDAYISASSSGFITQDYCFSNLVTFNFVNDHSVELTANQTGEPIYSCMLEIGDDNNKFSGPGTYQCGNDQPGYVELIVHGTENEFYKVVSGTVTVTEAGDNSFNATFNVTLKGYYNQETITFTGTAKY